MSKTSEVIEFEIAEAKPASDFENGLNVGAVIRSHNKFAAMSLGVSVSFTPEETEHVARAAELPPIADGAAWKAGLNLAEGTIVTYDGKNYQVLQGHISQVDWHPPVVPALFKAIAAEYAEWTQPQGAHDAYMKGDKVSYKGKKYESTIDNNVWSPEAYPAGWKAVK